MIKSPLNYTGNKYKLLEQIIPLFPKDINNFIDLFGGSFTVGVNVSANKLIYNDICEPVKQLIELIYNKDLNYLLNKIDDTIKNWKLAKDQKENYLAFRKHYNTYKDPLDLYILSCYSFSNGIRFNKKGGFNVPFGNRDFNVNMRKNFVEFKSALAEYEVFFSSVDFEKLKVSTQDFVYIDPPYLHTTANYNENGGWTVNDEERLLKYLDSLTEKGIRWAFSNVLEHKGIDHVHLKEWANGRYNIHYLDHNYNRCSANQHNKLHTTVEVLITNYYAA